MKRKKLLSKIIPAVLVLIFLVYLGVQAYNNLSEPITTTDASIITAEDKIATEGYFMRKESVVKGNPGSVEYMVADGAKVAKGQTIAMFFTGDNAAQNYQELLRLNEEIAGLEYVKSSLSGDSTGAKIDSLIYSGMQDAAQSLNNGEIGSITGDLEILQQLVANRNSIRKDNSEHQEKIDVLEAQRTSIVYALASQSSSIYASISGYFFSSTDGYESVLDPASATELKPIDLKNLRPDTYNTGSMIAGTLIDGYEWYYITTITTDDAAQLRGKSSVNMRFSQIESKTIPMEICHQSDVYDGEIVLILKNTTMDERYLRERMQSGEIVLTSYSGIKVPSEALRMLDDEWGVYCLEGNVVRFKPVTWIYQSENFYIVPASGDPKKGLYIHDQIVVSGKGLDGMKVIR